MQEIMVKSRWLKYNGKLLIQYVESSNARSR
jgi:hypothetical protein